MPQISVHDLMLRQVATVLEDASIEDAVSVVLESRSSRVFVLSRGGVLKGVIPEYELLKSRLCGTPGTDSVSTLTSSSVQTLSSNASIESIVGLFRDSFRSVLPVVDSRGRLIGQITRREVLWAVTKLLRPCSSFANEERSQTTRSDVESTEDSTGHSKIAAPKFLRRNHARRDSLTD